MLKIRTASQDDVDGIIDVMQDTHYIDYIYPKRSLGYIKKKIYDDITRRVHLVCIDSGSKKIVAYFIIDSIKGHLSDSPKKLNDDYAYHAGVGVLSSFRGKGIATKLTKKAFQSAKKKGFNGMYCDVGSDNVTSIHLQEKCGFKEIERYASSSRYKGILNVVFEKRF